MAGLAAARGKDGHMTGEDWRRLADYVVARRVELGMRDRRAFAEATGVTERTLGNSRTASAFPPALSVWSRTGSGGPRVRAGGYWQAGNLTWGRQTSGMPSMKTRHYGTSRAPPGCPPTWFAASSPSPGTGGKATPTQTSRPGGAPDQSAASSLGGRGLRHGDRVALRAKSTGCRCPLTRLRAAERARMVSLVSGMVFNGGWL